MLIADRRAHRVVDRPRASGSGQPAVRVDGGRVVAGLLPVRTLAGTEAGVGVWWLGVHGGAGETTLEEIFRGPRAADHAWPVAAENQSLVRVVLVARTSACGLRGVQVAMRQWHEERLSVAVVGLVLMADIPGRPPRGVRDLAGVIGRGVPRVWSFPWVEAWRAGEVPSRANSPKEAGWLLRDLAAIQHGKERLDVH